MILTPKNWNDFQHYKDREPSWIKLHKNLLTNYEFICLPVASRALAPVLWLLASEYKDGIIDASLDKIAFRLSMTRGDLAEALTPLIESGFFDASEPLAERKQEAIPEKEIQEQIEEEKDSCAVAKATRPTNEKFEEFWKAKPRRAGADPKAPAEKLFLAAVRAGTPADEIIAAAKRWAVADSGKVGTEYLPQAVKWLRDKRWNDYPIVSATSLLGEKIPLKDAVEQFARFGRWSKHSPVQDISQVPVELLAEHGLLPDGRKISA
jgi:hypothetical protein